MTFSMMKIRILLASLLFSVCAFAAPNVLINEVMPSNINVIMDDVNDFPDSWIELYNTTSSSIDIQGWYVSDDILQKTKWKINSSVVIPANGYVLLYLDESENIPQHATFRLDINGSTVFLTSNDGSTLIDSITYIKMPPNLSYGRTTNGKAWFKKASPGKVNVNSDAIINNQLAPVPEFSLLAGVYKGAINVSLSLPAGYSGLKIYYTTDCSEPNEQSSIYSGPLSFQKSTTLRAKVIDAAYLPRVSSTRSYIITDRDLTLPVLSITTDSSYLFGPDKGIFVWGKSYTDQYAEETEEHLYRKYSNLYHNWRRPMNLEYFDGSNHASVINQLGEMRISGGGSRYEHEQKSFIIYANKRFGTKRYYYPFFNGKSSVEKGNGYKSLVVRNAGNDCSRAFLRDAFIQNLYGGKTNVDYLAYQPVIVYINGEYWGIQNIRERSEDDYYLANYNLEQDAIDMYDNNQLQNGTETAFNALKNLVSGSFTYEELNEHIDIDNYLRYNVLYLFVWNPDWPGNNNVFWRPSDGKFRWVLKDLDWGFGLDRGFSGDTAANSAFYILNPGVNEKAWGYNETNTFLFRSILADKEGLVKQAFVDYYLVTLGDLLREDKIVSMVDSFAAGIRTEYPYHSSRWDGTDRFTAPNYRNKKALSPEQWEAEIEWIKKWGSARIRNVYDSLSVQFNLGALQPLEVAASVNDTALFFLNSIKVHYSSFKGKWPATRPLVLSTTEKINGYQFKKWVLRTISGSDTSSAETFTTLNLDLTNRITGTNQKIYVRAVFEKLLNSIGEEKQQNKRNWYVFPPKINGDDLTIKINGVIHKPLKVEIFDFKGNLMKSSQMKSNNLLINLKGIPSTVLLVSVTKGSERQVFKVIRK